MCLCSEFSVEVYEAHFWFLSHKATIMELQVDTHRFCVYLSYNGLSAFFPPHQ